MRLVKDNSLAGSAVRVLCVGAHHNEPVGRERNTRWFTLSEGYADLDGRAFVDYYCGKCAAKLGKV